MSQYQMSSFWMVSRSKNNATKFSYELSPWHCNFTRLSHDFYIQEDLCKSQPIMKRILSLICAALEVCCSQKNSRLHKQWSINHNFWYCASSFIGLLYCTHFTLTKQRSAVESLLVKPVALAKYSNGDFYCTRELQYFKNKKGIEYLTCRSFC